jgi:hypothetical protein
LDGNCKWEKKRRDGRNWIDKPRNTEIKNMGKFDRKEMKKYQAN